MPAQPQPFLTPEQYLELERAAEFRHEYYAGRMYAMSGGTHRHALIIANLTSELHPRLRDRPCLVTSTDLRVCVRPDGLYTYPDLVVVCSKPHYVDEQSDTLLNPDVVIEVLSPSSEAYDRGFKASQYRTVASLREYVIVSQNEPRVESLHRQEDGGWLLTESAGLESSCEFGSIACAIALAEIYRKVTFDTPPDPSHPSPANA